MVSASAELPSAAYAALAGAPLGITGIAATLGIERRPHTAPFGSFWAPSPQRLRFGCDRDHTTFQNLVADPRVAVSLITPPDIAITIFGTATVIRDAMKGLPSDAVVEIHIEEVKNDMLPGAVIDSGVTYSLPPSALSLVEHYMAEIRRA